MKHHLYESTDSTGSPGPLVIETSETEIVCRLEPGCDDSADANDDVLFELSHAVCTLNHLFFHRSEPNTPFFPYYDSDPTAGTLGSGRLKLCQ